MKIIKTISHMQKVSRQLTRDRLKTAFVPTMGALHDGHLALIRRAKKVGDCTIVSIYVNPAQFGPDEDLGKYPRTLKDDKRKLRELKVDYLFLPTDEMIYPKDYETYVELEKISKVLEGKFRPVHFRGVATILVKLFNIVSPDYAVFGRKDYQQSVIVKKLVKDLNLPIKIIVAPTVREKSGLALSSRNKYFNTEQKQRAVVLYNSLQLAIKLIKAGERNTAEIKKKMRRLISGTAGTKIEYIAVTDDFSLKELRELSGKFTISLAVYLDEIRLIDNIGISLNE